MASNDHTDNCQSFQTNPDFLYVLNLTFGLIRPIFDFTFGNFKVLCLFIILFLFLYILYKCYWSPVLYTKEFSEVGFNHLPNGKDRSLHLMRAQRSRQIGTKLPPPYPNGWYSLVESRDLKIGGVVPVNALGLNLCVYRGEDGVARIINAYCPHLGANLGVGGQVFGNCIQCPFHQWTFGKNGQCVSIPDTSVVPKGISIKTYHSLEIDGTVWVWYDAEDRRPLWYPGEYEDMKNCNYRGRNEFLVNAHIQEIPENGADVSHLSAVHTLSFATDAGNKYPFLNNVIGHHTWSAKWSKGDEDHKAYIRIITHYLIMKFDVFPLDITVHQIGPAHVRLRFLSPLGPTVIIQSVTPLSPLLQKVVQRVYTPWYNAFLGAVFVRFEGFQFERDVAIWNNKKYVGSPAYAKSDKTIRAFRSWFSQFYSEKSISFKDSLPSHLDW